MGREQSAYVAVGLFLRSCGVAEYQFTAVVERSSDLYLTARISACSIQIAYTNHRNPHYSINHDRLSAMEDFTAIDCLPKLRQKNCNSCVHAKRRCDRRTPVCSRCTEKKIDCIYGKTKVASQPDREEIDWSSPSMGRIAFGSPAGSSFALRQSPDLNYLGIMPMDPQIGVATSATESMQDYVMDTTIDGDISMDPFINLMGNSITPTQDQWLVPIEQGPMTERPSSPADEEIIRAYEKMAGLCVSPIQIPLPVEYSNVLRNRLPPIME